MDLAKCSLRLGGNAGQTIQKYDVTPAEIAVLRVVHGDDAVSDIKWTGEIQRSHRAEIQRLHAFYGSRQQDGAIVSRAVASLFPGAAARVFEKLTELDDIDESQIVSLGPDAVKPAAAEPASVDLSKLNKTQLLQLASERGVEVSESDKKADIIAALEAAPAPVAEPPVDEDEEMPDAALFQ